MNKSLVDIAAALRSGKTPLADYLDEVERQINAREPEVLALLPEEGRFDRLRRDALALDQKYPNPATRPVLFGVPVGVKDIFNADGFPTHGGSKLPPERLTGTEAKSVSQLKAAGTLILGKTVTTEFAYFAPGPTRNPHNPEHTPGGSSSGSAAAVGAEMTPLALGTQTIGSVNRPAAFCGVTGYKPSYERISREGVIPLSPSVDHIGFFTTDAASVELVAGVLVNDWGKATSAGRPALGIPEGPYLEQAESDGLAHFYATCDKLAAAGYEVSKVKAMPDFEAIRARHNLIVAADAARVHAEWFAEFSELYHPRTADLIRHGREISDEALEEAKQGRAALREELTALMDTNGIDLWITPSAPGPAPEGLDRTGDPIMNLPWTHSGLPTLTLPSGFEADSGLPYALQLVGRWQADEVMVAWAKGIEEVL